MQMSRPDYWFYSRVPQLKLNKTSLKILFRTMMSQKIPKKSFFGYKTEVTIEKLFYKEICHQKELPRKNRFFTLCMYVSV